MTVYRAVWALLAAFAAALCLWLGVPFWLTAGTLAGALMPVAVGTIMRDRVVADVAEEVETILWLGLATAGAAATGGLTSMLVAVYAVPIAYAWMTDRPRLVIETAGFAAFGYGLAGLAAVGETWIQPANQTAIGASYAAAAVALVAAIALRAQAGDGKAKAIGEAPPTELEQKLTADLRNCETRVKTAAARALEAERMLDARMQFFAQTSHEIGNQLNPMLGFSQMMAGEMFGPLSPKYKEYAQLIAEGSTNLRLIVDDVMTLPRIETGKLPIEPAPVSLTDLAASAVRFMRDIAMRKGVRLTLEEGEDIEAFADSRAVNQIALNLISNALKFTPEGGEVTVSALSSASGALLAVSDTGMGIGPDELRRLSRAFEQGEAGRKHGGVGLGLSVVRALAEQHGGRLDIESRPGGGSTIAVFFPNERAKA